MNTLNLGEGLLEALFEKRKSLPFRHDYTLGIIDENRLDILIERKVIRRDGLYIEMDKHYLPFYKLLLKANKGISTSVIDENIQSVYQLIDYYDKEDDDLRKLGCLRSVKAHLRKIGEILVHNVVSLQRVIDNTFKNKPSYKAKIAKLESLDTKRTEINRLIVEVEKLLDRERTSLLTRVPDKELLTIARELKTELLSAGYNLIHSQQDITDYLNQTRTQAGFIHKLRRIKYLWEQFELRENMNVWEVVDAERSVILEGAQPTLSKISTPYLQMDEVLDVILKAIDDARPDRVIHRQELGVISAGQVGNQEVGEVAINIREMMDIFSRIGGDLFSLMIGYEYNREMDFEVEVMLFRRLLSLYKNELEIIDHSGRTEHIEYAII